MHGENRGLLIYVYQVLILKVLAIFILYMAVFDEN